MIVDWKIDEDLIVWLIGNNLSKSSLPQILTET